MRWVIRYMLMQPSSAGLSGNTFYAMDAYLGLYLRLKRKKSGFHWVKRFVGFEIHKY